MKPCYTKSQNFFLTMCMPTSLSQCMAVRHTVQHVPQVTYCGTQLSSICMWLSDAKHENLYINHMHLNVRHNNLLFAPLEQVLSSFCTQPFRTMPNFSVSATITEMAHSSKDKGIGTSGGW